MAVISPKDAGGNVGQGQFQGCSATWKIIKPPNRHWSGIFVQTYESLGTCTAMREGHCVPSWKGWEAGGLGGGNGENDPC